MDGWIVLSLWHLAGLPFARVQCSGLSMAHTNAMLTACGAMRSGMFWSTNNFACCSCLPCKACGGHAALICVCVCVCLLCVWTLA